ncbi:hypothetical protein CTEN210_17138 [Chaetoceros tenuissimus]|uniref:Myb-like domain-containing protein n=1 Tax=Chaetoceros tenuissimus TaxID=426638 RepID=A0AAD3HE90_9STRA|nr:hypothetical protein CTEN210_17138 [Chaetoceros tenuissimus]
MLTSSIAKFMERDLRQERDQNPARHSKDVSNNIGDELSLNKEYGHSKKYKSDELVETKSYRAELRGKRKFSSLDVDRTLRKESPITTAQHQQFKRPTTYDSMKPERLKKGSRKKIDGDGRWSKRFNWSEELHRDFVSSIFDIGLKNSTPATIQNYVASRGKFTSEQIKVHLYKYRILRQKSKRDFISLGNHPNVTNLSDSSRDIESVSAASCSKYIEAAPIYQAFSNTSRDIEQKLVVSATAECDAAQSSEEQNHEDINDGFHDGSLPLIQLTKEEMCSPSGASFVYLTGLFQSLKEQLYEQRRQKNFQAGGIEDNAKSANSDAIPLSAPTHIDEIGQNRNDEIASYRHESHFHHDSSDSNIQGITETNSNYLSIMHSGHPVSAELSDEGKDLTMESHVAFQKRVREMFDKRKDEADRRSSVEFQGQHGLDFEVNEETKRNEDDDFDEHLFDFLLNSLSE